MKPRRILPGEKLGEKAVFLTTLVPILLGEKLGENAIFLTTPVPILPGEKLGEKLGENRF